MAGRAATVVLPITEEQRAKLFENGLEYERNPDFDPEPVVRLAAPAIGAVWLLCAVEPRDPSTAFGLCDLGAGNPEVGSTSLLEIATTAASLRLRIVAGERFKPAGPLSAYARAARKAGEVVPLGDEETTW